MTSLEEEYERRAEGMPAENAAAIAVEIPPIAIRKKIVRHRNRTHPGTVNWTRKYRIISETRTSDDIVRASVRR